MFERQRGHVEPGKGDKVFKTRLVGAVNSDSIRDVLKDIDLANDKDEVSSIKLMVASTGGSIWDGYAAYDHIRASEKPVDILAAGPCMSMGTIILQAGRERLSYPNTVFMIHPGSFSIFSNKYDESEIKLKRYKEDDEKLKTILCDRTGLKKEELEEKWDPIHFLNADDAKNLGPHGLIDTIIYPTAKKK